MAISIGEIKKWFDDCGMTDDDLVAIGECGLCLESYGVNKETGEEFHYYIEIGGKKKVHKYIIKMV